MPTITVRNIPDAVYKRLKASASLNHRSINGELIARLETSLAPDTRTPGRRTPDEWLAEIDKVRLKIPPGAFSNDELMDAINSGRP